MPTVDDVLRVARSWMGTKFQHQGRRRGKDGGVDCIGLIIEVCREVGLLPALGLPPTWDYGGYSRFPDHYGLTGHLRTYLPAVPVRQMRAGDVAVFSTAGGLPAHLGFVADGASPYSLLHAFSAKTQRQARVQEHRLGSYWLGRLAGVYRLPLAEG